MLKEMFDAMMVLVKVSEKNRAEFETISKCATKVMLDNEDEFRKLIGKLDYYIEQNRVTYQPTDYKFTSDD